MSARRAILRRAAWALPLLAGTAVQAAAEYRPVIDVEGLLGFDRVPNGSLFITCR